MSQARFHPENEIVKQSKSLSPKSQHSITINTTTSNKLTNDHLHRSSSSSNGIGQFVGFIRRKISRINEEDKQEFDDLKKIK